ncbi:MAG TPA: hypothetical protein VGD10_03810 [Allosphingosinicella sp.]|uniref:hypothetical protein n=1 Tax=Allosphingosinicella sp. TaxID=2823234 RepID=UPI002EDB4275
MIALRYFLYALAATFAVLSAQTAQAQLVFSLRTGNDSTKTQSMVYDSNACATPKGPRAMYLGGRITNNGATAATNVQANISGLGTNFSLAGGQAGTLNLGTIAPGGSTGAYWFIGYGCTNAAANPVITVTSSQGTVNTNLTITGTSTLSANATGFLNTATIGPGAVVGQIISVDVQYAFGGSDVGDEFYLQPSGLNTFNAGCFRLASTLITASTIPGIPVNTAHKLHFLQTAKQTGNGHTVTVRYSFEYACEGASTQVRPYAMGTSGTQLKYTGNYDTGASTFTITFPGATNPFTITKTADKTTAYAGFQSEVVYTVTVSNPSVYASRITSFVDALPAGASFVGIEAGSDVTAANSSAVPAAGATGTLTFSGIQDSSYLIPAGGSVKLVYRARMSQAVGTYVNSATGRFGGATTPTGQHTFTVTDPPPLTVLKSSQTTSDPMNGAVNPKAIPGARMTYTIQVANPYLYTVTSNSVMVVDATPAQLKLRVADLTSGSGPVIFQNGSPSSGLSYSYTSLASQADYVDFSNDGGVTWTYVPQPDSTGCDASVTHIRIRPQGAMNPNSSFSLVLSYVIK